MSSVTDLLLAPTLTFVLALATVTSFKLLNGRIVTRGLITDPVSGKVSALRVQMLLSTLSAAGVYGVALSRAEASLPAPDGKLLMLIGGSNGLLVGAQALRRLVRALGPTSPDQEGKS